MKLREKAQAENWDQDGNNRSEKTSRRWMEEHGTKLMSTIGRHAQHVWWLYVTTSESHSRGYSHSEISRIWFWFSTVMELWMLPNEVPVHGWQSCTCWHGNLLTSTTLANTECNKVVCVIIGCYFVTEDNCENAIYTYK
jgi:hypothetical protein